MSNKFIRLFLSLVKSAIQEDVSFTEDCSEVEWEQVYDMAKRNGVLPLLYDHIQTLSEKMNIQEELLTRWKNTTLSSMLYECQKYKSLRELLYLAQKQHITFIIFKGCVLANLYPKYPSRASCDTDILIYERDRWKAIKLLESMGFRKDEQASKELVYAYMLDSIHYEIELHFSLWEDYKSAKIELLDNMNLAREESLIKINACGMEVTTLGYAEHLIFQMFHIIKHFSLQGISVRYLVDITLYLTRYEEHIDSKEFWNKMELLSYAKFCESFFNICVQYLGMSPKILKDREIRATEDMEEFLFDLVNVGTMHSEINSKWQLLGIFTPFFIGEQEVSELRIRRRISILFPSRKQLPNNYAYAKKHSIMLPIAWLHRLWCYIIKWLAHKKDWYHAKEKLNMIEHRLTLMRSLGLIEGGKK